jgi:hypothetical protein
MEQGIQKAVLKIQTNKQRICERILARGIKEVEKVTFLSYMIYIEENDIFHY